MSKRYLIIGATSDIALGYLNSERWNADDLIVAHFFGNSEKLLEFAEIVPCEVKLIEANFLIESDIRKLCEELEKMELVPTHILHVSALPVRTVPFRMESWKDYQNQVDVQCKSFFEILQAVLPQMGKAHEGKIVSLISSCVLGVPPKGMASYTAGKYMLLGMMKSIAAEFSSKNIQINMISPSTVDTKFNEENKKAAELAARNSTLGRNATIEDVVPMIKYLLSDQNTFMSGANIPLTAGEVF